MAIEDAIFNTITSTLGLVVNVVVRLFGFSEDRAKKSLVISDGSWHLSL